MRIHGAGKRGVCVVKTIGAKSEQLSPSTDSHCAAATGVYVSACSWLCTCMCSCVAGERDVLKKWVTERGVPRQDWCALVLCSLLLPAVSAAVSRQCTHTRLWAKHEWQPWEVAQFSLLPSRMHLYLLEMRCYLLICLFLQKGTFQKLIHYQKFSIPLQFRHTHILVHNKKPLEKLGALITRLLLLP